MARKFNSLNKALDHLATYAVKVTVREGESEETAGRRLSIKAAKYYELKAAAGITRKELVPELLAQARGTP